MKRIVLTLVTLVWSFLATAQKTTSTTDSLVVRNIYRGIKAPDEIDSDNAGATLLQIYLVHDSLKIKSLYSSGNGFDFTDEKHLVKWMNRQLFGQIPEGYEVIIPLYFEYSDGSSYVPSEKVKAEMKRKIKKLKRHFRVLEPGTIVTYLTHVRRLLQPQPIIIREGE